MLSTSSPVPALGRPFTSSTARATKRPTTKDGEKQAIWVPMLNSASKGKDLAEKQLILLGGSPEQQREFLQQLNPDTSKRGYGNDRQKKKLAPISNRYTLGYTYQDVLDGDDEDAIARLNIYMLSNSSSAFAPLLKPLLTTKTVKDTLITILLDWSDPFTWARQLRQWVRLLRSVILSLDDKTKIEMEESMTAWKERRVGPDATTQQPGTEQIPQAVPVGPGEWDEGLGIPLSVVCIQSEKIDVLEQNLGWQDEQFDFLMQWLRCVLLKHGGSLVYTATFDANNVQTLIHSSLSIPSLSLLKRTTAKPNYLDRDKILIPPNWDSWGKMRVLREATNLEAISDAWSVEIQGPADQDPDFSSPIKADNTEQSAVAVYEATLPKQDNRRASSDPQSTEERVTVPSVQEFLQSQHTILEGFKAQDEKEERKLRKAAPNQSASGPSEPDEIIKGVANPRMAEHIGPYQINVSGIEIDAEEATRRLRERETERTAPKAEGRPSGFSTPTKRNPAAAPGGSVEGGKTSNAELSNFFASLMKKDKRGGVSGSVSPTRGSPAPERGGGGGGGG